MAKLTDNMESLLSLNARWHGSIDDQYGNIGNLLTTIDTYTGWTKPTAVLKIVGEHYTDLGVLIPKCRSSQGLAIDKINRNGLLKTTVGLCVGDVKFSVYDGYDSRLLTAGQVHQLGFLLPGELGGYHPRVEPTAVLAESKVRVLNEDNIRVVIDQSADENAARVHHGWPTGVRNAVIVLIAVSDNTEVVRKLTTHLYNDIRMPEGSRGQQFIVKSAFLRHIDDEPRFGNEPTFSMPLTTEDLAAALDRQHHEDFEEHIRIVEDQRREIERLRAQLK
jgi:hypothetical protein